MRIEATRAGRRVGSPRVEIAITPRPPIVRKRPTASPVVAAPPVPITPNPACAPAPRGMPRPSQPRPGHAEREARRAARAEAHASEIERLLDACRCPWCGRVPVGVHKVIAKEIGLSNSDVHAWLGARFRSAPAPQAPTGAKEESA